MNTTHASGNGQQEKKPGVENLYGWERAHMWLNDNAYVYPAELGRYDLRFSQVKVFAYLVRRLGKDNHECWPSIKTIARDTDLSRTTVKRALNVLESKRIISVGSKEGRAPNAYRIIIKLDWSPKVAAVIDSLKAQGINPESEPQPELKPNMYRDKTRGKYRQSRQADEQPKATSVPHVYREEGNHVEPNMMGNHVEPKGGNQTNEGGNHVEPSTGGNHVEAEKGNHVGPVSSIKNSEMKMKSGIEEKKGEGGTPPPVFSSPDVEVEVKDNPVQVSPQPTGSDVDSKVDVKSSTGQEVQGDVSMREAIASIMAASKDAKPTDFPVSNEALFAAVANDAPWEDPKVPRKVPTVTGGWVEWKDESHVVMSLPKLSAYPSVLSDYGVEMAKGIGKVLNADVIVTNIHGLPGTGKTTLLNLCVTRIDSRQRGGVDLVSKSRFMSGVSDKKFLTTDEQRKMGCEQFVDDLINFQGILILDDVVTCASLDNFSLRPFVIRLVHGRWEKRWKTVYVSNDSPEQLTANLRKIAKGNGLTGEVEAILDRISNGLFVHVVNANYRQNSIWGARCDSSAELVDDRIMGLPKR